MDVAAAFALAMAGLIAFSGAAALVRGERSVTTGALVLALATPVVLTAFYWARLGALLTDVAAAVLLAGGAALGLAAGRTIPLRRVAADVVAGRISLLHAPHLLALGAVQAAGALESLDWLILGFSALLAATALSTSGSLLVASRRSKLPATPVPNGTGTPASLSER